MSTWRPTAGPDMLRRRASLLRRIRHFFDHRKACEVQTPVLTAFGITDVNIESLALAGNQGFLRTSPEYCHKRLLAAGFGDLYELGPVFRAGESGSWHRTEFTLLEWYRVGWDWKALAAEAVELIRGCRDGKQDPPVRWLGWHRAFAEAGIPDPLGCSLASLRTLCPELEGDCDRDVLLDYLFATRIQASFPPDTVTVVHHYPASQAALARLDPDNPDFAERFEIFAGPVELANGYRELTDADAQRRRFEQDNRRRTQLSRPPMPVDARLLSAMRDGLPDCSGVALGVDRLLMAICDATDIATVQSFANG